MAFSIPTPNAERVLRHVRFDDHRLLLWDTHRRDRYGKYVLGYALYEPDHDEAVFSGEDYFCPTSTSVDSDESVRGILCFLTLREGDVEEDYFANYTERQIEWRDEHAEQLSIYGMEPEEDDESGASFEEVEPSGATATDFDDLGPHDYAALWGDRTADGALFYGYSDEGKKSVAWLQEFHEAVQRLIACTKQRSEVDSDSSYDADLRDLASLDEFVLREIREKENAK